MKIIKQLFTLSFFISAFLLSGQSFQGVATYETKQTLKGITIDSTSMSPEMLKQVFDAIKRDSEKTYILTFNKDESIYKENEKLKKPGGVVLMALDGEPGLAIVVYKNIKEARFANQNESYGKRFLIKGELEKWDWILEDETKNIGEYVCYKATLKRGIEVEGRHTSEDPKKKEITITAWYTIQIPVSYGPGDYHGLPGLILEVNDGSETVICSKIVLNPRNKINVSEPKKGKVVTKDEYELIMEKKAKEIDKFND